MQYFRNNAEMMAYIRGKAEKLEPLNVRESKKKKKPKKKEKEDVGKAE